VRTVLRREHHGEAVAAADVEHAVLRTQRESADKFPGGGIQPVAHHHVGQAALTRITAPVGVAIDRAGFACVTITRHRRTRNSCLFARMGISVAKAVAPRASSRA
jgi:hypothetical protein